MSTSWLQSMSYLITKTNILSRKQKSTRSSFFGFVKHIEIIGEAVYMLTKEFRAAHPEVEWEAIEGMRHVLVHGYYTIRPEQVWQVVEVDVPALKPQIEVLLSIEE